MSHARNKIGLVLCLLGVLHLAGCQHLRLPAIDPTGERIFQPAPNSTTLINPFEDVLPGSDDIRPAFTRPDRVEPCPEQPPVAPWAVADSSCPPVRAPLASRVDGRRQHGGRVGEIRLFPGQLVAPVGTEVVLRAGLCGAEGYYVTGQPVEWMLSQESVGHFVQLGESGHLKHLLHHRSERKISNNFAVAKTLSSGRILTRGTASTADDVQVLKGQSWITVTSAAPGISHVTVVAPKAVEWNRRRRTATIHWVDAEWRLPQSAALQSGQTARLTTTVNQASSGAPLTGWIVRYEIEGESDATFADGTKATEKLTDTQGNAIADMISPGGHSANARVRIQIIRPARQGGEIPRMIIGQGWSNLTWSSAELSVRATGPDTATTERPITYRIRVENPGNITAKSVVLTATPPSDVEITGGAPAGQKIGDRYEWQLGDIGPNTLRTVDIHAVSKVAQSVRFRFEAKSASGLQASQEAATQFIHPSLKIKVDQPQGPFKVGDVIKFNFEVHNTGTVPLTNVQLIDTFETGLEHAERHDSPLSFAIGTIPAGEPVRKAVSFRALRAGRHCHTLRVTADGGQSDSVRSCVDIAPADPPQKPTLSLKIEGTPTHRIGTVQVYDFVVRNDSKSAAKSVLLVVNYPPSATPKRYTEGGDYQKAQRRFVWDLTTVEPGDEFVRQVELDFTAAGDHRVTAVVDSQEKARDEKSIVITAIQPNRPAPPNNTNNNAAPPDNRNTNPAPSGKLELGLTENTDSLQIGDIVAYDLVVKNNRNRPDQNVVITIELPAGLSLDGITGSNSRPTFSNNDKTITLSAIREMRAGEQLPRIRITAVGKVAGDQTISVKATSRLTEGAVEIQEKTSVYK